MIHIWTDLFNHEIILSDKMKFFGNISLDTVEYFE